MCIQSNFKSDIVRFIMIATNVTTLIVLLIVGTVTSVIDPSDPLIKEYIENNQ